MQRGRCVFCSTAVYCKNCYVMRSSARSLEAHLLAGGGVTVVDVSNQGFGVVRAETECEDQRDETTEHAGLLRKLSWSATACTDDQWSRPVTV